MLFRIFTLVWGGKMVAANRKTKVLHVIRSLELGGAERLVVNYARYCNRDKFKTYVCCLSGGGPLLKEAQQHAAGVDVLNKGRLGLIALIRLIRILRHRRIDIIHTHNFSAHLFGGIAGFICRTPCIVGTEHNVAFDKRHPVIKRFLWHAFDRIIAVSEAASFSHMRQWRIPNKKMVVIRNGVSPPEDDDNLPNKADPLSTLGLAENTKIVLNVGNLTEQKAQHILIEAAEEVLRQLPDALFLIIGEGEQRPKLEALIEEKALGERVKLLGSRTDVTSIVGRSSVLALSSLWEGLPLTILEAMAAEKPVVVTDVGGNKEAVRDGETGYVVPSRRPDLLADRILRVLNDEALAEEMGTQGRLRYEAEFRAERQIRKTEDLYDMLLRAHRKEIVPEPLAVEIDRRLTARVPGTAAATAAQPSKVAYVMGMGIMGSGGGAERQLIELLRRIDRKRYSPFVCSIFPASLSQQQRGANWQMIRKLGIPMYEFPKRIFVGPWALFKLYRVLRRERPEVVHSYCFPANWRATIAARCARVPVIVSSDRNVNDWMKWYHCMFERFLTRFRKANVVNAVALKKFLAEREGIPVETIRVIYNGVDLTRFERAADVEEVKGELGIPPQAPVVGLVAVLSDKKDIPTFLRAAVRVKEVIPDTTFLIVGDGRVRSELEGLAADLQLGDRVRFVGHSNEVPRLISAMDISVLSSLREGCSNSILESMALSKPVVATDVGGNGELIDDGGTGFLVAAGDDEALADKIIYLLENRDVSASMGRSGHEKVQKLFSVDRMVSETTSLYQTLLAEKQTST
jgi:glycosyltransferase involved in cell wall biosynthesis